MEFTFTSELHQQRYETLCATTSSNMDRNRRTAAFVLTAIGAEGHYLDKHDKYFSVSGRPPRHMTLAEKFMCEVAAVCYAAPSPRTINLSDITSLDRINLAVVLQALNVLAS